MKYFGVTDRKMEEYLYAQLPAREGVLADMEAQAERDNVPVIGPLVGRFIYTLALAATAKDILDVGTATGYSAMWLALAAQQNGGLVVTLEKDPSRAAYAEAYFRQANLAGVCAVRRGDALTIMRGMQESFDLIFLDVLTQFDNPETALQMLDLCVTLLNPGGLLLSDNALRSGRVLSPPSGDPSTQGIVAFNTAIMSHPRLVSSLVPIRDGVSMSVKVDIAP